MLGVETNKTATVEDRCFLDCVVCATGNGAAIDKVNRHHEHNETTHDCRDSLEKTATGILVTTWLDREFS